MVFGLFCKKWPWPGRAIRPIFLISGGGGFYLEIPISAVSAPEMENQLGIRISEAGGRLFATAVIIKESPS